MNKLIKLSVVVFALLAINFSCKKDNETSEFSNKLTLGTGVSSTNHFNLTGEGTTFKKNGNSDVIIYFKLQTTEDMGDKRVEIDFVTLGDSLISYIGTSNSHGHIMISCFVWLWGTGNYSAKAYLSDSVNTKFVTSKDFTIQ